MSEQSPSQWNTIAAEVQDLGGAPDRTLKPREVGIRTTGRDVLAAYEGGASAAGLVLGEVLGEGGRGVVRLATQTSMLREVAVKAVRPVLREQGPILELLQEAWIAGRLEHPNIVPVYDIARGEDGRPLIVLKRIEGEPWSVLLEDPERAAELFGVAREHLLEAHLRVLIAVCNAIDYAHGRGIVHLDLKPENIMICGPGEFYVLDWGVAAALYDESGKLPLVSKRKGIVGTPAYMAPEMTLGEGEGIDARTDIYLLGAVLFELLAGHPPHQGETIMAVLHAVVHADPQLPDGAPHELAGICRRAMAREPSERFASAEELRVALRGFMRHRGSARLTVLASERLGALEQQLAAGASGEAMNASRQVLFAEVRFGFAQALASWPDNAAALAGLERAFTQVIEYELEHGDPQVGADLAAQFDGELDPELRANVAAAVKERQASLDELEQLRRDQDLRIGQRTRVFVVVVFGVAWTLLPLLEALLFAPRSEAEAFWVYLTAPAISLVVLGGLRIWARDSLTRTQINRLVIASLTVALIGQLLLAVGGRVMGVNMNEAMTPGLLLVGATLAVCSLTVDRRGLAGALGYALAYVAASWRPEHYLWALSASNAVLVAVLGISWRPERIRGPIPEPDHRA